MSPRLMNQWLDLVSIAESISFSDDCDSIIWAFDGSSKFSVQAIYKTISFRGIQPVYTPIIWDICVPPRVHIFLWLLSNNKTLTRTNLAKRRHVDDTTCLFCSEQETVHHLFFECCVPKVLWTYISEIFHVALGTDYESIARWWISNKTYKVMNCFSAALMWCLWKFRNEMCFQGKMWRGEKLLLSRLYNMLKSWRILFVDGDLDTLNQALSKLQHMLQQPPRLLGQSQEYSIMWTSSEETSSSTGALPGRTPSTSARLMVAEAPADFPTSSTDFFPSLDAMTSHVSSSFGSGFWAL